MNAQIQHYQDKLTYEIDAWDLSILIDQKKEIMVLDCRSTEVYASEHIPTAYSLPHRDISAESTKAFPKSALYITYCDGIGCNASTKGALAMAKLGFRVKELMGGLDWWKRDGHSTEGEHDKERTLSCGC